MEYASRRYYQTYPYLRPTLKERLDAHAVGFVVSVVWRSVEALGSWRLDCRKIDC